MNESTLRVLLIDDHAEARMALAARLAVTPGLCVVGATGDLEEGLLLANALAPEIALVDTKRTDGRGLEAVARLVDLQADIQVVVLTSFYNAWEQWASYRSGAMRYLLKDVCSRELIAELRKVASLRHAWMWSVP